ncbi:MAG: erythromycin biosynthesis sensory transduction protein eryC1 [Gammaproteobacteria bacterium]|nr:erythromycin biosynthesis sensory transduction protein eryC1 [Gammaproteobacteria bacterium]
MIYCANPKAQYLSYRKEIDQAIKKVLNNDQYILGSEVSELEQKFASYIGVNSSVGVANGTDAIEISLRAMGIGEGDKVITVSHSAVATIAGIESTGASALVIDLEEEFYTMDHNLLEAAYDKQVKAVVAVHIYGQSSQIDKIKEFCVEKNIFLIEDVAQAHGASFNNKRLGSIGDVGCFSCYPTKNLGAIGDGGIVTTNNSNLAKKIRMIREYGWNNRISEIKGRNSRLDEIQAAVLNIKLKNLDYDNNRRKKIAEIYDDLNCDNFITPNYRKNTDHVFHLYVCRLKVRDKLITYLNERDIFPGIHYSTPIHLQPAYLGTIELGSAMTVTETICHEIISLPMYPELTIAEAEKVAANVQLFFKNL